MRVVVPYAAGGGVDIMARILASRIGNALGQQFVIDNRGGAGAIIGTDLVAKAAPDGYTLLFMNPAHVSNPSLNSKLPFDPIKDFAAVSLAGLSSSVLVVHPLVQAKTVKELVALALAKPGQLNYASAGVGSAIFLAMELFKNTAINAALAAPDVRERVAAMGAESVGSTAQEFSARIKNEIEKWARVFRKPADGPK